MVFWLTGYNVWFISSLVGQPKFPWPLLAPEPWGFFRFGVFFCWKTPRGFVDFLLASWISFKNLENFPPNLWRLSKMRRSCCILQGALFDFQTPKLGCSSKTLQTPSQLATENPLHPESWETLKIPHFSWIFGIPRKWIRDSYLRAFFPKNLKPPTNPNQQLTVRSSWFFSFQKKKTHLPGFTKNKPHSPPWFQPLPPLGLLQVRPDPIMWDLSISHLSGVVG